MKINQKFMSIMVVLTIIGLIFASGPAQAITVGVSDIVDTDGNAVSEIAGNEEISFTAKVDLHTNDVLPEDVVLNVIAFDGSSDVLDCEFDIDGIPDIGCTGVTIELISSPGDDIESSNMTLYGYGYGSGVYSTTNVSFGAGYGYTNVAGYGFDAYNTNLASTAEFVYNITWTTPNVNADTDYEIELLAFVEGTDFDFSSNNVGDLTVVPASQAATDEETVAGVKAGLKIGNLLNDYTSGAKNRVIADLYLPTLLSGVNITWNSTNPTVIATNGSVTRQGSNTTVNLTATFSKGIADDTKTYTFIVKKTTTPVVVSGTGESNVTETEVLLDNAGAATLKVIRVASSVPADEPVYFNVASLVNQTTKQITIVNNLSMSRETTNAAVTYSVDIPQNTVISGGSNWNGIIALPSVQLSANYSATDADVDVVVNVGSGTRLNFSNAVKIVIPEMAGKTGAWASGEDSSLTEIDTECDSITNPTNIPAGEECYIDSGDDLIIWTYHFTTFAAVTPDTTSSNNNNNNYDDNGGTSTSSGFVPDTTKVTKVYLEVSKGDTIKVTTDKDDNIGISEVSLTFGKSLSTVKLSIEKYNEKPTQTSAPTGTVYRYYNIEKTGFENLDIDGNAKIKFEVESAWLTQLGAKTGDVTLLRYVDGRWIKLDTRLISETSGVATFEAETPGFSYFAVHVSTLDAATTTSLATDAKNNETTTDTPTQTTTDDTVNPEVGLNPPDDLVAPDSEETGLDENNGTDDNRKPWVWVLISLLVIAGIVGGYVWYKGRKEKGYNYKSLFDL